MRPPYDPAPVCKTLEGIASVYARTSKEYRSLELAARALLFIHVEQLGNRFARYLSKAGKPLTASQRRRLKAMGLDP